MATCCGRRLAALAAWLLLLLVVRVHARRIYASFMARLTSTATAHCVSPVCACVCDLFVEENRGAAASQMSPVTTQDVCADNFDSGLGIDGESGGFESGWEEVGGGGQL